VGVNVLLQDISRMLDSDSPCYGFSFPSSVYGKSRIASPPIVRGGRRVLVPELEASFPSLQDATVRSCCVAVRGDDHQLFLELTMKKDA